MARNSWVAEAKSTFSGIAAQTTPSLRIFSIGKWGVGNFFLGIPGDKDRFKGTAIDLEHCWICLGELYRDVIVCYENSEDTIPSFS